MPPSLDTVDLTALAARWAEHLDRDDTYSANANLMAAYARSQGGRRSNANRSDGLDAEAHAALCKADPRWPEWRRSQLEAQLRTTRSQLSELIAFMAEEHGLVDQLPIFRNINVAADWHRVGAFERPLGLCWSYDAEAAHAWYAARIEGGMTVTVAGLVRLDDIDWDVTLCQNALSGVGEDEKEIRLTEDATVLVEAVYRRSRGASEDWAQLEAPRMVGVRFPAGQRAFDRARPDAPAVPSSPGLR